jgi:DHA2 family multidrug resistance protein
MVQEDLGYNATMAGVMVSPGGVVAMVMMFVAGRLVGKIQPKYLIAAGAVVIALSMYALTNTYGDIGFWFMARSRMLFAAGIPLMFIPVTAASYDGIPPDKTGQASALINAARNTGGSIGISLINNVLWRREQFHQNMLVDQALPSSVQYQDTLHQMTNYFIGQGSSLVEAQGQTIAWVGQQVQLQASFLAYMDAFWVLALLSLAAVPFALSLRNVKPEGRVSAGH